MTVGFRNGEKTVMATEKRPWPETNGRLQPGSPGGPGRPKGAENKSTVDARVLRQRLIDSWDKAGGDRLT